MVSGGLSSIGFQLNSRNKITGFGSRRTRGRGIVRKTIATIARPALGFLANKIADVISGNGTRKRRRTVRGSSWKLTGSAVRKPRKTLVSRKRRTAGAGRPASRATTRRAPRRKLGMGRKRVTRRVLF